MFVKAVLAKAKNLISEAAAADVSAAQSQNHYQNEHHAYYNGTSSQLKSSSSTPQFVQMQNQQHQQQHQQQMQQQQQQMSSTVSYQFMKQYFNSDQQEGRYVNHTNEFKKMRDNTIGRYVVQTNKLLITLDKLISIDDELFEDDSKRESNLFTNN